METYTGADAITDLITSYDVEHVFFNPGIDNVPLLESIAKYSANGQKAPRSILCLDESVALMAAQGNYMVSGKPQVVLVHSELGTQQVGGALHNAQWNRVPVILCADSRGPAQRVNWLNERYNQGLMVRNCVKWDHQITADEDFRQIFRQALRIATTEPCGPVYLAYQRDAFISETEKTVIPEPGYRLPLPISNATTLQNIAEMLLKAENPLIVTGYSGRKHQSAAALTDLAETLGSRVTSTHNYMNFPTTHPLFAYVEPGDVRRNGYPFFTNADVILVIDYDMPYAPPRITLKPDVKIIHFDADTIKQGVPLWNRPADVLIQADSGEVIPALTKVIRNNLTPQILARIGERRRRIEKEHHTLSAAWRDWAISKSGDKPISPNWLCQCIDEAITEDTLIVNQTISYSQAVAYGIRRTLPGSIIACAGGSIGWAPGATLGAKLAAPDKTVVALMGDGAFVFGCPVATLWSADFYHAPFLSVIFDNQSYGAIKGLFQQKYEVENMGADISPPPDFALVAQSCRAYGRIVTDPGDVMPALREGLEQVSRGRAAVIDVRL